MMTATAHLQAQSGQDSIRQHRKTGMEPFFEFLNALLYALTQIRIEWAAYKSYQRNIPQGELFL